MNQAPSEYLPYKESGIFQHLLKGNFSRKRLKDSLSRKLARYVGKGCGDLSWIELKKDYSFVCRNRMYPIMNKGLQIIHNTQ